MPFYEWYSQLQQKLKRHNFSLAMASRAAAQPIEMILGGIYFVSLHNISSQLPISI
jgi:hypothetical protein